jgi:hypothetical protein
MRLNLGCGTDHLGGWINVDQFHACRPDLVHDLETVPWPFADSCAEEVLFRHSLEHMGRDPGTFQGIMKELYRVCASGAIVRIIAPDPRHLDFFEDPTHVRPVVPGMFKHFSLAVNEEWIRLGRLPGTPLAIALGVNFEWVSAVPTFDPAAGDGIPVVQTTETTLRAVKPFVRNRAGSAPPAD